MKKSVATFGAIFLALLLFLLLFVLKFPKKEEIDLSHPWKNETLLFGIDQFATFSKEHDFFSKDPIIGKVSSKKEDIEATNRLLRQIHNKVKDPKKRILAVGEVLAKVVAYRDFKEKDVVAVPITTSNGQNIVINYTVDKVFDIWAGMPAFGLVPSTYKDEAAPILLFRGTDTYSKSKRSWASVLSDLDLDGPGYTAFLKSKEIFRKWMDELGSSYSHKTRVIGYSLGGAFAQYTAIFESDLLTSDPFQPSITFNAPGVNSKVLKKWDLIDKAKKPLIVNFRTKYDLVSKYGNLIGYTYKLVSNNKISILHAHVKLVIGEDQLTLLLIEKNL